MKCTSLNARRLVPLLLFVSVVLVLGESGTSHASNVQFVGHVGYSYVGNTAVLTADKVQNFDVGGFSGTLQMELWAFASPYTGAATVGYKVAQYSLGQLSGGVFLAGISSGTIAFVPPPNGTWYFSMGLTEYIGTGVNNGYATRDYVNFPTPVVIGPGTPPPPAITPQIGNWSNPNELGSGYTFDFKHGVLVVVIFSYQTNGASQWYIASGPLTGYTFSGSLDKFVAGQCISCAFSNPVAAGSDGTVSIVFSSSTSATMYLPGGRVIQISPTVF